MENAFNEYIKTINDFTEIEETEMNESKAQKKDELQEYVTICEKRLLQLQNQKRKVMEQYAEEEIAFDEYKSLLEILNEKHETMQVELDTARLELPTVQKMPDIFKEDIIANLQENWDYLNNKERMMFLQRFVKKITVNIEKKNPRNSIARISGIEFNLFSEAPTKNRGLIRQTISEMKHKR